MPKYNNVFPVDLANGEARRVNLGTLHQGDKYANRVGAIVYENGSPVTLGGTCNAFAVLSNGLTVPMTNGVVTGNQIYCDLIDSCYAVEGTIDVKIKWTNGTETATIISGHGYVSLSETDTPIDPGDIIPSVENLIDAIEEAEASIPQDYSVLSANMNALTHIDLSITGNYIAPSGAQTVNAEYNCSDFIPVNADSVLTLRGFFTGTSSGSALAYAFYDASKAFISGQNGISTDTTVTTIPSGAAYVRFSSRISQGETPVAYVSNHVVEDVADLMPRMATAEADVADLKSAITEPTGPNLFNTATATNGKRLDITGNLYTDSSYFSSDYIEVEVGDTYKKNSPVIDAYHRTCTYNANKEFVRVINDSNSVEIQTGEAYVRFCGLLTEKSSAIFKNMSEITAVDTYARSEIVRNTGEILDKINEMYVSAKYSPAIVLGANINVTTGKAEGKMICARTSLFNGYDEIIAVNLTDTDYLYRMYYYSATGDMSTGNGYLGYSGGWENGILYVSRNAVKVALVIKRVDGATMTSSDETAIQNALFKITATDWALTKKNKPADSFTVGNAISEYNGRFSIVEKTLQREMPFSDQDNFLKDSLFKEDVEDITKDGFTFEFDDAHINTDVGTGIFNRFSLPSGDYTLMIDTEDTLSHGLYFTITTSGFNKGVSINAGRKSNAVQFNVPSSATVTRAGFWVYQEAAYDFTGTVRVILVKGSYYGFDNAYKINNDLSILENKVEALEEGINGNNLIFFDDFNNQILNTKVWAPESGFTRNYGTAVQYYRPENATIENGCLKITAKKEEYEGYHWTSASIQSIKGLQFGLNTRITTKLKFENFGDGAWPALWSYGGQLTHDRYGWPTSGEIDIFEGYCSSGSHHGGSTLHYGIQDTYVTDSIPESCFDENWHVWELEWIENLIRVKCDGNDVASFNTSQLAVDGYNIFNDKAANQRLVMNIAVIGNNLSANTPDEMAMYIDYVKVENISKISRSSYLMFEEHNISCEVGDDVVLIANPDVECPDKSMEWEISDESVISYHDTTRDGIAYKNYGTFIALSAGTAKVKVTDKYGNHDVCTITVT